MVENRGKKKHVKLINTVKELKKQGFDTGDISTQLDLSPAMVRYYLRQECSVKTTQKESVATCFFRQTRHVQERIAKEIGYNLDHYPETKFNDIKKEYDEAIVICSNNEKGLKL